MATGVCMLQHHSRRYLKIAELLYKVVLNEAVVEE